jgi:hypothetical protein
LLFGDSHGMVLLKAMEAALHNPNIRIDQATRFATAPLVGFDHLAIWRNDGASEFCESVFNRIEKENYDCVVLVAAWPSYTNWPSFPAALDRTLSRIKTTGTKIVFVLAQPDQQVNVPKTLSSAIRRGNRSVASFGVPVASREVELTSIRTILDAHKSPSLLILDSAEPLIDDNGLIRAELDGESMYSDNFHLSEAGAKRVVNLILPSILEELSLRDHSLETNFNAH